MKLVVPTITAKDSHQYRAQTDLVASISDYAHVDLSSRDFNFASELIDYKQIYLDPVLTYSVHVMYKNPLEVVRYLLNLPELPKLIILQTESDDKNLLESIKLIKDSPVSLGIALLQNSNPQDYSQLITMSDQVLIFSGNLGQHGGSADLNLLSKIEQIKKIKSNIEIAWDGGITAGIIQQISQAGVDIFYTGSTIHNSEDPYLILQELQNLVDTTTSA